MYQNPLNMSAPVVLLQREVDHHYFLKIQFQYSSKRSFRKGFKVLPKLSAQLFRLDFGLCTISVCSGDDSIGCSAYTFRLVPVPLRDLSDLAPDFGLSTLLTGRDLLSE